MPARAPAGACARGAEEIRSRGSSAGSRGSAFYRRSASARAAASAHDRARATRRGDDGDRRDRDPERRAEGRTAAASPEGGPGRAGSTGTGAAGRGRSGIARVLGTLPWYSAGDTTGQEPKAREERTRALRRRARAALRSCSIPAPAPSAGEARELGAPSSRNARRREQSRAVLRRYRRRRAPAKPERSFASVHGTASHASACTAARAPRRHVPAQRPERVDADAGAVHHHAAVDGWWRQNCA